MYRCLQIPEIILNVLQEFIDPPHDAYQHIWVNHPSVLALALSSKHFLEPALDMLWSSPSTIRAICQFFVPPGDKIKTKPRRHRKLKRLARWIEGVDNRRFDYYASRIKTMSTSSYDDHDKLCRILYDSCTSRLRPMRSVQLPNLRHLEWCIEECDDAYIVFACIASLAGPRFQSLNISLPKLPEDYDSAFLGLIGFNVEYLQLQAGYDNSWPSNSLQISTLLCHLRTSHINLREEPTCELWHCLSMLSHLHTLEGHFVPANTNMSKTIAAILSGPIPILQFPVLRRLTWTVYSLDEYTALLRGFAERRDLQTVGVELYHSSTPSELNTFFDALRASCSQDSLTSFSMEYVDDECCHDEETWISPTLPASGLLRPLFTFGAIEVCKISCCMAAWDDELLREISVAWPNLKDLRLRTGHAPCTSTLTLLGLKPLAQNCSRIEHIELEVGTGSSAWTNSMEIPKRDWNCGPGGVLRTSVDVSYHPQPGGDLGSEATARRFLEAIFPCGDIHLDVCPYLDDHLRELEEASS